jgi:S-adenosylmethionine decarboxylase
MRRPPKRKLIALFIKYLEIVWTEMLEWRDAGMDNVGTEWLVDAVGCQRDALCDVDLLAGLMLRAIAELDLRLIGEVVVHQFPEPGGVTAFALLTESHLTCHTYPERGIATFNLYCCRARPAWPWAERLRETLGAQRVTLRTVERASLNVDEQTHL